MAKRIEVPDIDPWGRRDAAICGIVQSSDYALRDATLCINGTPSGRNMSPIADSFAIKSRALFENASKEKRRV